MGSRLKKNLNILERKKITEEINFQMKQEGIENTLKWLLLERIREGWEKRVPSLQQEERVKKCTDI